jgi:hypothetical protein
MTPFSEENTYVFIVRLWREARAIESASLEWRGVVEHVPSGVRHYLKDLNEIILFMRPYLERMGVRFDWHWRLQQELYWWKNYFNPRN